MDVIWKNVNYTKFIVKKKTKYRLTLVVWRYTVWTKGGGKKCLQSVHGQKRKADKNRTSELTVHNTMTVKNCKTPKWCEVGAEQGTCNPDCCFMLAALLFHNNHRLVLIIFADLQIKSYFCVFACFLLLHLCFCEHIFGELWLVSFSLCYVWLTYVYSNPCLLVKRSREVRRTNRVVHFSSAIVDGGLWNNSGVEQNVFCIRIIILCFFSLKSFSVYNHLLYTSVHIMHMPLIGRMSLFINLQKRRSNVYCWSL